MVEPGEQDPDRRRFERQAIARARAGELDAFEPLVRDHAPRIIRMAYHFLGSWDEARDLAQETFARAYRCLNQYDADRPLGAWLCTIAARLATDRLRRRRTQAMAEKVLSRLPASGISSAHSPDPLAALSLREALARLTPRQRQAVVLCDLHGFTAAEAAGLIGCSASTVRVLRFLARARLRDLLGRQPAGRPEEPAIGTVSLPAGRTPPGRGR